MKHTIDSLQRKKKRLLHKVQAIEWDLSNDNTLDEITVCNRKKFEQSLVELARIARIQLSRVESQITEIDLHRLKA